MIMTKDAQDDLYRGCSVNIGIGKDNVIYMGKI